ncbi:hypothetical protein D3C86_1527710 [compost metagenome]
MAQRRPQGQAITGLQGPTLMTTESGLQLGGTRPHHRGHGHAAIQGEVGAHAMAGGRQPQALAAAHPPAPAVPDSLTVQGGGAVGTGQRQPTIAQETELGGPQHQLYPRRPGGIAHQAVRQDQRLPVKGASQGDAEMAHAGATEVLDSALEPGTNDR